ncbi:hypothetical protein CC86DRAFT_16422 [Ophiobolus disseminans]|uniref:Uncharacterized protein n=1 Tax=Ophiobolus disseminans TaxID=1469910 RepID=A0A6A7ANC8_9PLEO|nr:hypothetical protein CC86DRAFT_16422 [Ophiobolus disseminans]
MVYDTAVVPTRKNMAIPTVDIFYDFVDATLLQSCGFVHQEATSLVQRSRTACTPTITVKLSSRADNNNNWMTFFMLNGLVGAINEVSRSTGRSSVAPDSFYYLVKSTYNLDAATADTIMDPVRQFICRTVAQVKNGMKLEVKFILVGGALPADMSRRGW